MRILVIEDEPDMLRGFARSLRDEGYAVDTAADGEDGLFKALDVNYDAIVLDVMLPRLDGRELLKRIRVKKKTPVLLLTGLDRGYDRTFILLAGGTRFEAWREGPGGMPELLAVGERGA